MKREKTKKILAWIAVVISALFANLWAFWGIIENFHEGWYFKSFFQNVTMMFGQYLLFPLIFIIVAAVSIKWNKVGAVIHLAIAIFAAFFFGEGAGVTFIAIPLALLAILYWFGKLEKKRLAYVLVSVLPLFIILGLGVFHGIRVANRYNDNNFEARLIKGNGVELIWAPQGPGWTDNGASWSEAKNICAHLSENGKSLSDSTLNIWRLPTVDEAVRSLVYHGKNAGGVWNQKSKTASYREQPNKESPLWNIYSKVIYWWTADEVNEREAYIIVYNGGVYPRQKKFGPAYLTFRAVKETKK